MSNKLNPNEAGVFYEHRSSPKLDQGDHYLYLPGQNANSRPSSPCLSNQSMKSLNGISSVQVNNGNENFIYHNNYKKDEIDFDIKPMVDPPIKKPPMPLPRAQITDEPEPISTTIPTPSPRGTSVYTKKSVRLNTESAESSTISPVNIQPPAIDNVQPPTSNKSRDKALFCSFANLIIGLTLLIIDIVFGHQTQHAQPWVGLVLMLSGAYGLVIHCLEPIHYSESSQRPHKVLRIINILIILITIVCTGAAMYFGGDSLSKNNSLTHYQIAFLVLNCIGFLICCCLLVIIVRSWNHKSNSN